MRANISGLAKQRRKETKIPWEDVERQETTWREDNEDDNDHGYDDDGHDDDSDNDRKPHRCTQV